MATAKTDAFTQDEIAFAAIARALGHPARVRILRILLNRRSCVTGSLVDLLPLSQSTVSQHLKELREAGLVDGVIDGPRTCYCVTERAREMLRSFAADLVDFETQEEANDVGLDPDKGCC
ncbi:MAG: ArsR family transcriptional regulator [Spirochaetaceae bacterium]|nr:MAG: ArsR family transcriptional regulator [Spirochaetaceae bacterium]